MGETASAGEAMQHACEASEFILPGVGDHRLRRLCDTGQPAIRLADRRAARGLDVRIDIPAGAAAEAFAVELFAVELFAVEAFAVGTFADKAFGARFGVPTDRNAPVDRADVRTGGIAPGSCTHAAGRVRFHRSGRLKTSHDSRLFKGEGPTGEDNAARAAGPPTG
ncbi:hypothetical protein [Streptomyces sp. FH025]|uniref:hypothetical protein n=1 Tax=Streptomyces sp. FH025 TaxID=2815937 RepID=UPI001A9F0805|nr:hypothetical protein [Streptomyces sp. FH025]MBO1417645.1 hypothetical protein [Streptomyces sp. FH025]